MSVNRNNKDRTKIKLQKAKKLRWEETIRLINFNFRRQYICFSEGTLLISGGKILFFFFVEPKARWHIIMSKTFFVDMPLAKISVFFIIISLYFDFYSSKF